MLRIPKSVDYGILILLALYEEDRLMNAKEIATICGIPHHLAAKILKTLHRKEVIESKRGAHGGYRLVRASGDLTVGSVYETLEGPLVFAECMEKEATCRIELSCRLKPHLSVINRAIVESFQKITLRTISEDGVGFPLVGGVAI